MTDRQTNRRQTDRQTEKSNPSMPYDTFACLAGLITLYDTTTSERLPSLRHWEADIPLV